MNQPGEFINPTEAPQQPGDSRSEAVTSHNRRFKARVIACLSGLAIVGGAIAYVATNETPKRPTPVERVSLDDFSSGSSWEQNFSNTPQTILNPSYWDYDIGNGAPNNPGWGNSEAEYYTNKPQNVEVKNGALIITALQGNYDGSDYTSARIKTDFKMDFEYGKLEIEAKLPAGVGTWPAIWLEPQGNKYLFDSGYNDPLRYLNDGEIDIMEAIGAKPGIVTSSAQSREYNPENNNQRTASIQIKNDTTEFHQYGLEWTPNQLVFTIDGKPYHTVNRQAGDTYQQWPYDQPYYLIINLALGGSWGGIDTKQYPPNGIDNKSLPATFDIKYIKYYPYIGPRPNNKNIPK